MVKRDRPNPLNLHRHIWPVFRRKLFDAVSCGASRRWRDEIPETKPTPPQPKPRSDNRLSELLRSEAGEEDRPALSEEEARTKTEALEGLQRVVRGLQEEERAAAAEVRRLARVDADARRTLALLGAIPPLIGLLESGDPDLLVSSLYALLNLGIGNDMNKAAIVKAGALHKMLRLVEEEDAAGTISEAVAANLLGLSALDSNKPVVGAAPGAIRFLVTTAFGSASETAPPQTRQDSLRALLNLSLSPTNAQGLLESGLVEPLLRSLFDDDDVGSSERALSILGNLASTPEGRREIAAAPDGIPTLIDALGWAESPGCQEKAAYVLMVMAHKSYADRTSMVESGIVSALLELTLMGTTLAQKRASRMLECLRVGKGKMVLEGAVSAPLEAGLSTEGPKKAVALGGEDEGEGGEAMVSEERKAVKQLVQQSLQSNMRRIARRANLNLPAEMVVPSDRFRALASAAGSSTSKSLPF